MKLNYKSILKVTKTVFLILVFIFIGIYLYKNSNEFGNLKLHYNLVLLPSSFLLLFGYILGNLSIWFSITKKNNCSISLRKTIVLRLYSELGKYIPGKVWGFGMLMLYYNNEGISKKSISVCVIYELILSLLGAVLIFVISLVFVDIEIVQNYKTIALSILGVFFILIHPKIIKFTINRIFSIIKRTPILIELTYLDIIRFTILYTINWLVFGLAFFVFINSFQPLSIKYFFFLTGAFSLASLIGFFAIFAPAGLGVREGILIVILKYIVTAPIAGIISITSRIWVTIGELLLILIVFIFDKTKKIL